jgi:DNA repair photolyase
MTLTLSALSGGFALEGIAGRTTPEHGLPPDPKGHPVIPPDIDARPVAAGMRTAEPGQRVFTPVVDQHASWIAVNPIQGCPKRCDYCFLHQRSQAGVAPVQVVTPEKAAEMLLTSPFYGPERAVALFTWTDVMALASSRTYLAEFLARLADIGLPNPIVLITKCRIPRDTLEAITRARTSGLRVIVYLSYSGLDSAIEAGIRHEQIVANFPLLASAGIPIVHYWRPAFPVSATTETMTRVLDLAARYAACTMAAGLKVEAGALDRLSRHWPELAATPGATTAECVYPAAFWDFIHRAGDLHPGHPVFHTNSCALACVLGEADRFGVYGNHVCTSRNRCPAPQRARCATGRGAAGPLARGRIGEALAARGLANAGWDLEEGTRTLIVHAVVPNSVVSALTQDLGIRVVSGGQGGDAYWSSGTSGAQPLVIGEAR